MKLYGRFALKIAAGFLFFAFGLAQAGYAAIPSRYTIDLHYDSGKAVIPEPLKAEGKMRGVVIAVARFSDVRRVDDKKVIGWVKELDGTKVPVFSRTADPALVIAEGVKDYLKKAGYQLAGKTASWDLKEGSIPRGVGKVAIGGAIEEMDITCWTGVFSNDYKINLKLSLVVADAAGGKILYKGSVAVSATRTDTTFSEGQLGYEAGMALGDAIGQMFEGKTVAQKIREAGLGK